MKRFLFLLLPLSACQAQQPTIQTETIPENIEYASETDQYYAAHPDNGLPSQSIGTVSGGSLKNGKLLPFNGPNFQYFDTESYLNGRAFVHEKVKKTLMDTYATFAIANPQRQYKIMECSNESGGKLWPHRTHQNGLSVDLMVPLVQDGQPYFGLDDMGSAHYALEFDNAGKYSEDPGITLDFEELANQILVLDTQARKNGLKIAKVIFKIELKDDLFATPSGKKLKASGIYFAQSLTPLINSLHDDHYHVDFMEVK